MTEKDFNRAKLHRAASIRFALNAERRVARRKRWAEEKIARVLLAEFMTGDFYRDIGDRHGMTSRRVREIILSIITPEHRLNRERMLNAARMRKYARERKPDLIPRPAKIPTRGFPSISAAAVDEGMKPRTLWTRMKREKQRSELSPSDSPAHAS